MQENQYQANIAQQSRPIIALVGPQHVQVTPIELSCDPLGLVRWCWLKTLNYASLQCLRFDSP